jgi:hypothetical protein
MKKKIITYWNDDIIYHNVIDYLHDEFQLTKNNENILLSWNGWLKKSTFNYCDANVIYKKTKIIKTPTTHMQS